MKPDDDEESWAFMKFLGREVSHTENTTGMELGYVGIGLMFFGLCLTWYSTQNYILGGSGEVEATFVTIFFIGVSILFSFSETEANKKLAVGLWFGFCLASIDASRLWWGLTGVGIQALAFAMFIIAERKASLREEDDIGSRLYKWSWNRAQERADKVWKVFMRRITGKRSPSDTDDSGEP
jgi:hypothetical protein